jgi:pimeloyl-ACP methyl ester carboxylesterase
VLLRAGGGALTTDFTTLAEDLTSHGFFVVGFDAPYRSVVFVMPDGRVVVRSPGFAGRMDLQRLGIFGHSFGGATALEFRHQDARCKVALDIDGIPFGGVVLEGLGKPGMLLLSDHGGELADPATRPILAALQSIYDRLPDGRLYAVIRRANHFSFGDQILLNSPVAMTLLRPLGFGGLDGRRGLAISADYVQAFFDVVLNGAPRATLTSLAAKYPEIQIEGR